MSADTLGIFILWVVTLAWLTINTFALKDAIFEYHDEKEEVGFTTEYGTKEGVFIAQKRARQAAWFVLGFCMMDVIGVTSTIRLIVDPPPPDNSWNANFSRVLIIIGIFGFWRAKRMARVIRKRFRELFMPPVGKSLYEQADHIENLAEDTNQQVHDVNRKIPRDG